MKPHQGRRFDRAQLPAPAAYFRGQDINLRGGGEWLSALCPFHDDSNPSLRVRLDSGGYRCMACNAKGGNVLDFHMRLHRLTFVDAAKDLGAWRPK
jgi:DNA primase